MRPSGGRPLVRRGDPSPGKIALGITSGLIAFLLVTAWSQESLRREADAGRRRQLADVVAARQRRTAVLERQLDEARSRLGAATRGSRRGRLVSLQQEIERLAGLAGSTEAVGSGIAVRMTDSPLGRRGDTESVDFRIQDVDLQLVVNALWSSGAEAIAVNGQRLVGTTAIRSAGGAVLVNYRVLTSPYRIVAIGDPDELERAFSRSSIARRFRSWVDVYQLGFTITKERRLVVPAYAGAIQFRYATPAPKTN